MNENAKKIFHHALFYVECDPLGNEKIDVSIREENENHFEIALSAVLRSALDVGDWQLRIRPSFEVDFTYTPHLTPENGYVIDMHVFRTPVLMMGKEDTVVCVLPDAEEETKGANRVYMDLDVPEKTMTVGVTTTEVADHVLYRRTGKASFPAGKFSFRIRILILRGEAAVNPFREVLSFYWKRYGHTDSALLPGTQTLLRCVEHTYTWAFQNWEQAVWQEFTLNGLRVGAPQMIVVAKDSPNCMEPHAPREPVAIWNQAWFCSLRSAQGLFRYARRTGNADALRRAQMTKELALLFPQEDGLFDTVIAAPQEELPSGDVKANWAHSFFGNSNRNPRTRDLSQSPRHVLDMSWTALHMLSWYRELEADERLVQYVTAYADRLLRLQDEDGFFPAWIDRNTGEILPELRQSPESAVSATLLFKLYELKNEPRYLSAALRALHALTETVLPCSRWEDFETYWSCSGYGKNMLGKTFERNHCYKQCSLSPFYMAQAFLCASRLTGEKQYLHAGERCLTEMLMYQSSYQPSGMPIPVIGGFGVMNVDAELNDARQSLFAELIVEYGIELNREEYVERGLAALRASFSMMYCPENAQLKPLWEKRWPFFNERDYGFMMENYGHEGFCNREDLGLGEFTIYDWGNGAASEAVLRMLDHYPDLMKKI